jgi:DNA-binding response OmpR family regulator
MTFDIILMDMQMPLMDGYEATELIRSNQQWDKIPIIAVTANNSAQDCKRCLETGCSAYIAKPFKFEQLIEEIKHQLHNGGYTRHKKVKSLSNIDFIQDLLPDFFSSMTEMMEKLKYAIEKNDTETILFASHAIKGTAGMYGFMDVSKLAHQIEKFAPQQDYYELNVLYKHLEILLTQAHKIISKNQAIIS